MKLRQRYSSFVLSCLLFGVLTNLNAQDVYCATVDFTAVEKESGIVEFVGTSDKTVVEWHWYFGDQNTSREVTPSNQYTYAGDYEVCLKVVVADNCTGAICKKIRVNTGAIGASCNLNVDFKYEISNNFLIAKGWSTANTNAKYFWTFGDNKTGEGSEVKHQYENKGEYEVCLIVSQPSSNTAGSICTERICKKVVIQQGNSSDCGLEVDIKFEVSGLKLVAKAVSNGGDAAKYSWTFGDGATGDGIVVKHEYTARGTYELCLTVSKPATSVNQLCTKTVCKKIQVGQTNTTDCGLEVDIKYVISGQNLVAKAVSNGGDVAKYSWTFGDGTSGDGIEVKHEYTAKGTYELCLTVSKPATSVNQLCTKTVCKKIQVGQTNTTDCGLEVDIKFELNGNMLFAQAVSNGGNGAKYSWNFGDGATGDGYETKHEYLTRGEYKLCLTVTKPAISVTQLCTKTVCKRVVVGLKTNADCELKGDFIFESTNSGLTLQGRSNDPNATYHWTVSGTDRKYTGKDVRIPLTGAGVYNVCLIIVNGDQNCREQVCKRIVIGRTNIIYPNPTADQIFISSEDMITGYSISNQFARQIQKTSLFKNQDQIDVTNLPSGMYILTLYFEDGSSSIEKFYKN